MNVHEMVKDNLPICEICYKKYAILLQKWSDRRLFLCASEKCKKEAFMSFKTDHEKDQYGLETTKVPFVQIARELNSEDQGLGEPIRSELQNRRWHEWI